MWTIPPSNADTRPTYLEDEGIAQYLELFHYPENGSLEVNMSDSTLKMMTCAELKNYGSIRMGKKRLDALETVKNNVHKKVLELAGLGLTSYMIRVGGNNGANLGLNVLYREINDIEHLISEEREMVLELLQGLIAPMYPDARIWINYPDDDDFGARIDGPSLVIDWS